MVWHGIAAGNQTKEDPVYQSTFHLIQLLIDAPFYPRCALEPQRIEPTKNTDVAKHELHEKL